MPAPYCYDHPRPSVTVDLVVFTMIDGTLRVLLVRRGRSPFAGQWAIPGGFLGIDEPPEDAARRELREETGVEMTGPIEPVGFFAAPDRDPRGRTITLAYATVIRPGNHAIRAGDDAAEAAWRRIETNNDLAFDHADILQAALSWLRRGLEEESLGLSLLPNMFDMKVVHNLFGSLGLSRRKSRAWLRSMERKRLVYYVNGDRALYRLEEAAG
jgi:8-oxo-dGTP diphosphatase